MVWQATERHVVVPAHHTSRQLHKRAHQGSHTCVLQPIEVQGRLRRPWDEAGGRGPAPRRSSQAGLRHGPCIRKQGDDDGVSEFDSVFATHRVSGAVPERDASGVLGPISPACLRRVEQPQPRCAC